MQGTRATHHRGKQDVAGHHRCCQQLHCRRRRRSTSCRRCRHSCGRLSLPSPLLCRSALLQDFVQTYFPLHGLDPLKVRRGRHRLGRAGLCSVQEQSTGPDAGRPPTMPLASPQPMQDFLAWWHLLVFVEGAIYQADEENEAAASRGGGDGGGEPGSACERARGSAAGGEGGCSSSS